MSRLVSFEYLNRQLVWQELSEFMLFLLPLINVTKVSVRLACWGALGALGLLWVQAGRSMFRD